MEEVPIRTLIYFPSSPNETVAQFIERATKSPEFLRGEERRLFIYWKLYGGDIWLPEDSKLYREVFEHERRLSNLLGSEQVPPSFIINAKSPADLRVIKGVGVVFSRRLFEEKERLLAAMEGRLEAYDAGLDRQERALWQRLKQWLRRLMG